MKGYKSGRIHNSRLSRELKENGWLNFSLYVIRVEGDNRTLLKCEYGVMKNVGEWEGIKLDNRFSTEKDRRLYQYLIKKGKRNLMGLLNRNMK